MFQLVRSTANFFTVGSNVTHCLKPNFLATLPCILFGQTNPSDVAWVTQTCVLFSDAGSVRIYSRRHFAQVAIARLRSDAIRCWQFWWKRRRRHLCE